MRAPRTSELRHPTRPVATDLANEVRNLLGHVIHMHHMITRSPEVEAGRRRSPPDAVEPDLGDRRQ
jgi:hypothetical protein